MWKRLERRLKCPIAAITACKIREKISWNYRDLEFSRRRLHFFFLVIFTDRLSGFSDADLWYLGLLVIREIPVGLIFFDQVFTFDEEIATFFVVDNPPNTFVLPFH